ncbi:MAG: hypothetical protein FJW38_27140 [Acidobacteria bacterium]|nr:hypothetical protein [Acidobacteriota bacterium]
MKQLALLLFALGCYAADITGEWKATAETANGQITRTLSLKAEGAKLTGETVSSFAGKSVIENGKIDGDNFSFTLRLNIQGNEMTVDYKGKVTSKDDMKFSAEIGGQSMEFVAKRVK